MVKIFRTERNLCAVKLHSVIRIYEKIIDSYQQ